MPAKDVIGRHGEQLAASHLRRSGLTVLARNWRCAEGELDIVACEGAVLVICEVKTRSSVEFGWPAEAVTGAKAARLRRLAACYLAEQRPAAGGDFWPDVRFDVVSVVYGRSGAAQVEHLRGVL